MASSMNDSTAQRSQKRRLTRLAVLAGPVVILAVGGVVLALGADDEPGAARSAKPPVRGAADQQAREAEPAHQPAPAAAPATVDPRIDPAWLEGSGPQRIAVDELMGKPAPALQVDSWINSKPLSLADLQGKTVLVFFWSPTCHTCQQAMPALNGWYKRWQTEGRAVEFVGVCTTNQAPLYAQGVEHHGIPFPTALDRDNATWSAYHANGTPDFYVIDPEGVLRAADVKNNDSLRAVFSILNESDPQSAGE